MLNVFEISTMVRAWRNFRLKFAALVICIAYAGATQGQETIDIHAFYTGQALTYYNGDLDTLTARIDLMISWANQSFQNSGVNLRMRRVGLTRFDCGACGTVTKYGLAKFTSNVKVLNQRNASKADFAFLFTLRDFTFTGTKLTIGFGGLGLIPRASDRPYCTRSCPRGLAIQNGVTSFSMVAVDMPDILAHVIGHNMGLEHSPRQGKVGVVYPYGRGFGAPGNFVTNMAYINAYKKDGSYPQKIPFFSNPNISFQGSPTGEPDSADATRAINNDAHIISQFSSCKFVMASAGGRGSRSGTMCEYCVPAGRGTLCTNSGLLPNPQ